MNEITRARAQYRIDWDGPMGAALSDNSKRAYQRHLSVGRPTNVSDFIMMLTDLTVEGKKPSTIAQFVAAHRWAEDQLEMAEIARSPKISNYLKAIKRNTINAVDKKLPFTPDQIRSVLPNLSTMDEAITLLGFGIGLRRSEICAIRKEHITVDEEATIFIPKAKQGSRTVVIPQSAKMALARQLVAASASPWLFPGQGESHISPDYIYDLAKRIAEMCGLDPSRYGAHSFRAGFIVAGFEIGSPIHEITNQTGHRDYSTAMGYAERANYKAIEVL